MWNPSFLNYNKFLMPSPGLEPGLRRPKRRVISISLRGRDLILLEIIEKNKILR